MGDAEKVDTMDPVNSSRGRLTGAPALRAHVTLALGLALCVAAFWFELERAVGGNSLSWAYVFEWPLLGGFAVYMWWKVIHPEGSDTKAPKDGAGSQIAPEFEGMLAAWQAHQVELSASREHEATTDPEDR